MICELLCYSCISVGCSFLKQRAGGAASGLQWKAVEPIRFLSTKSVSVPLSCIWLPIAGSNGEKERGGSFVADILKNRLLSATSLPFILVL